MTTAKSSGKTHAKPAAAKGGAKPAVAKTAGKMAKAGTAKGKPAQSAGC